MIIGVGIHGWTHVAVPVYYNHLAAMASWMKWADREGHELAMMTVGHAIVAKARERVVAGLLELGADYWLSLDTDHMVQPSLLPELLKLFPGPAMASGLITKRLYPYETVAYKFILGTTNLAGLHIKPGSGVCEVDGCAMGCTLVDLKKLQKLPKPWFADTEAGRSDLNLCKAFRAVGERILVHSNVLVGHLSDPTVVMPDTAEVLRAEQLLKEVGNG